MYRHFFKRLLDVVLAVLALAILSPIFLITLVLLAIQNGGKPFFFQERPGKNQRAFRIIKFKSMNDRTDAEGNLLPDFQRMTPIGRLVRKLSIDELPQLINVLKGEMSLIGPRPLLFKYIPLYSPQQNRRHEVKPGSTGWAQVNGRNAISWKRKFELDTHYVDHVSLGLDLKILYLTVIKVLKSADINQSENRPMMPFDGTN